MVVVEPGSTVVVEDDGLTVVLSPGFVDGVEEGLLLDEGAVEDSEEDELEDEGLAVVLGLVVVG